LPAAINHAPAAINRSPAAINYAPVAINRSPAAINYPFDTNNKPVDISIYSSSLLIAAVISKTQIGIFIFFLVPICTFFATFSAMALILKQVATFN